MRKFQKKTPFEITINQDFPSTGVVKPIALRFGTATNLLAGFMASIKVAHFLEKACSQPEQTHQNSPLSTS